MPAYLQARAAAAAARARVSEQAAAAGTHQAAARGARAGALQCRLRRGEPHSAAPQRPGPSKHPAPPPPSHTLLLHTHRS
jgi:hypothetical protein